MKNKIYLPLLSLILSLCLLIGLTLPVFAAGPGSQSWNLDILDDYIEPTDDAGLQAQDLFQMEKYGGPGDNGQGVYIYNNVTHEWEYDHAGEVSLAADGSQIWISDQKAETDITFYGDDVWELELVIDGGWDPEDCSVQIGKSNGTKNSFISFETFPVPPVITWDSPEDNITVLYHQWQAQNYTILKGEYLSVQVTNLDKSNPHFVYCGEADANDPLKNYSSCLTSPGGDPGYPVPELTSALLLGGGVLALGGFVLYRRKHPVLKNKSSC